jgi:hypothetical protein
MEFSRRSRPSSSKDFHRRRTSIEYLLSLVGRILVRHWHPHTPRSPPKSHALKKEFREPIRRIKPIFVLSASVFQKSMLFFSPFRLDHKGRIAIVTNVGLGCGGRGNVGRDRFRRARQLVSERSVPGRTALMRTVKTCGPGTPTLVSSFVRSRASPTGQRCAIIHRATGAKKPGPREERVIDC